MENKPIKKPEIVVFAGPNGSGKSTITANEKAGIFGSLEEF